MKKILSVILAVLLMISVIPTGLFSITASAVTTGTTGDCTWTLVGTILTISGNGYMADYNYDSQLPWGKEITSVIIEDKVENVGNYAFNRCEKLKNVTMGDGIRWVGERAFLECENLKEICFSSNLLQVCDWAFYGCSNLVNIHLPNKLAALGASAFKGCRNLQEIVIPSSVQTVGESVFESCSNLSKVTIEKGLKELSEYMFGYCDSIKSIVIPDSVNTIRKGAFASCDDLYAIYIPVSVTVIEQYAFASCKNLSYVWYTHSNNSISVNNTKNSNDYLLKATWHYNACKNEHLYLNNCDNECNRCGWIRTISHTYDNNCDVSCNICEYVRNDAHSYSSECDNYCNVCNTPREVNASHSFANALSTKCDFCEHTRKLESISVTTPFTKLLYLQGSKNLNVSGGQITLLYDDESTGVTGITADMVSGFDTTELGEKTLTIAYGGKTTTLTIYIVNVLPGDINGDAEVNIVDLALLKKVVAGLSESLDVDLNGDANTDVVDLALLKKTVAGLVSNTPLEKISSLSWGVIEKISDNNYKYTILDFKNNILTNAGGKKKEDVSGNKYYANKFKFNDVDYVVTWSVASTFNTMDFKKCVEYEDEENLTFYPYMYENVDTDYIKFKRLNETDLIVVENMAPEFDNFEVGKILKLVDIYLY